MGGLLTHQRPRPRWERTALELAAAAALLAFATACGEDESSDTGAPTASLAATRSPASTRTQSATGTPSPTAEPATPSPATATASQPPTAPATQPPTSAPAAGNVTLLTVVDKQTALPSGYVPPGLVVVAPGYIAPGFSGSLRAEAYQALTRMLSDAYAAGNDIYVRSAYRSYSEQAATFAYWVSVLGEAEARRVSAEPGHSEHQLGTTVDLTDPNVSYALTESFGATASGQWLMASAHLYGFALSYPAGAEPITGYAYEPWHWRFIGVEAAAAWKASGLTLVEYLRGVA